MSAQIVGAHPGYWQLVIEPVDFGGERVYKARVLGIDGAIGVGSNPKEAAGDLLIAHGDKLLVQVHSAI